MQMEMRIKEMEQVNEGAFVRGFACALAFVADQGGSFNIDDALLSHGFDWNDLVHAGVAEYDLNRLAECMESNGMRRVKRGQEEMQC